MAVRLTAESWWNVPREGSHASVPVQTERVWHAMGNPIWNDREGCSAGGCDSDLSLAFPVRNDELHHVDARSLVRGAFDGADRQGVSYPLQFAVASLVHF